MMKFTAIAMLLFFSLTTQADEFSITWENQRTISIKDGQVTMPGLRHTQEKFPANSCHRTYLASAQQLILEPRFAANERCISDRNRSQTYQLVIGGKKQTVVTCTRLAPRFERIQGQMTVCNRQRDD
jgi:hypothetical protein